MRILYKQLSTLVLAIVLFLSVTLTAKASETGIAGANNTISAGGTHNAVIKTDGTLWTWGSNFYGQLGDGTNTERDTPVKVMDDVTAVSAGENHTAVIKADGTLWTWGKNFHGELGDGTTTDHDTPVKVMDDVKPSALGSITPPQSRQTARCGLGEAIITDNWATAPLEIAIRRSKC